MKNIIGVEGILLSSPATRKSPLSGEIKEIKVKADTSALTQDVIRKTRDRLKVRSEKCENLLVNRALGRLPQYRSALNAVRSPFIYLAHQQLISAAKKLAAYIDRDEISSAYADIKINTILSHSNIAFGRLTTDTEKSTRPLLKEHVNAIGIMKAMSILERAHKRDKDYTKQQSKLMELLGDEYVNPHYQVSKLEIITRQILWAQLNGLVNKFNREDFHVRFEKGTAYRHFKRCTLTIYPFGFDVHVRPFILFQNRDFKRVSSKEIRAAISLLKHMHSLHSTNDSISGLADEIASSINAQHGKGK